MGQDESNTCKPIKFNCQNFRSWQQQMKFWLTTLCLYSVIHNALISKGKGKISETFEKSPTVKPVEIVETGKESSSSGKTIVDDGFDEKDYLCHGRILSALSSNIYNIFCTTKTSIELWEALDFKYGSEDAGLKRYYAEKFLDFQMVDGKTVMEQAHDFQNILFDLKRKGMELTDSFLVASLIKKLPPSWSEFGRMLKQKPDEYTFDELLVSLNIEEKHREKQLEFLNSEFRANAHVVQNFHKLKHSTDFKKSILNKNGSHNNNRGNYNNFNRPKGNNINQRSVQPCWVCGKTNHKAKDCHHRKGLPPKSRGPPIAPKPQANVITMGATSSTHANRNQTQEL
ncbi:uncharacterized protein LOC130759042 [Actinidia eriantha]|uniref:uncharacterized protein LOC130759042 n=1 Tax=Actinidia eriantha TaxID=165200 RepID=UPI002587F8EB|nr:uncharacterized protein LOC130759042 [Actinidia eriantha]